MRSYTSWHSISGEDCLRLLESSTSGISSREAANRLQEVGPNQLQEGKRVSLLAMFIDQFRDFMIVVLLVATLISGILGEYVDAITIIAIVLINAILGFVQEFRAERAISALKELTSPQIEVMRGGREEAVDVRQLVPGDIVLLRAGDRVPADVRLLQGTSLEVEEAALTGESLPVRKATVPVGEGTSLADRTCMLYAGTLITRGYGQGVVVATGMHTEVGLIAELLQETERAATPLQERLSQLGHYIVWACLAVCVMVVLLGIARGEGLHEMFLVGVSLAVAAIPEGLPAIVTIALAIGVQRMIRVNAIVRKLPAVETLGCATVICSDKTGTLTKNEMTVRSLWLAEGGLSVTGEGYAPQGKIAETAAIRDLDFLLTAGLLCNNSDVIYEQNGGFLRQKRSYVAKGDPTEAALVTLAKKGGVSREQLASRYRRVDEIPFDSERKRMSVVVEDTSHKRWLFSKGAPDVLLARSTHYYHKGKVKLLTGEVRQLIAAQVEAMGQRALRVLAAAYRPVAGGNLAEHLEKELVFIGLYGMIDPPRPEARAALQTCRTAGVRTIMITGDHATTARAIGIELGLVSEGDRVVTGVELDRLSDGEWQQVVQSTSIFARVSPHHKLEIVRLLKKAGQVVAMTGDGINDAPALMEADIGVAMGKTGTDVAQEASALVLQDDNFATIVGAIKEGRAIYDNIRKFIRYLLACNVGELFAVFFSMIFRLPLPLRPLQILWVNLVTDGLPAMALGLEKADKDIMLRKPRPRNEGVFARGLAYKIVTRGILIGLATTAVFALSLFLNWPLQLARTMALATLVVYQLFHVFDCRSETMGIIEKGPFSNRYLIGAIVVAALLLVVVIYLPAMQAVFDTCGLDLHQWGIVLLTAGLPTFLVGLRRVFRHRSRMARRY